MAAEGGLLVPGAMFGDFRVVRELGRGGMGAVYLVEDAEGGQFAVKIVDPVKAERDPEFVARFIREGEFAKGVNHPNLISVYDMGQDPDTGYCYLVMDYMPGGDVHQLLAKYGRFPIDEAVRIVALVANALVEAHRRGVVHRDIKPGNIMFDARGIPHLADLGVAKFENSKATVLTSDGIMIGTPAYMAPEQIMDSHSVDARADIYSLGIVLFEMLAGKRPNEGDTVMAIVAKAVKGEPIPDVRTLRPEVPATIAQLLNVMCAPQPEHRLDSAQEVVKIFTRYFNRATKGEDVPASVGNARSRRGAPPSSVSRRGRRPWTVRESRPFQAALRMLSNLGEPVLGFMKKRWLPLAIAMAAGGMILAGILFLIGLEPAKAPDSSLPMDNSSGIMPLVPTEDGSPRNDSPTESYDDRPSSEAQVQSHVTADTGNVVEVAGVVSAATNKQPIAELPPEPSIPAHTKKIVLPGGESLDLMWCAPGNFWMGEGPKRGKVSLTKGFWIGKYEVTQKQWKSVMGEAENHSYFRGDDLPVDSVSWKECRQFCEKAGHGLRLPTEAEWEYACRAGTTGEFAGNVGKMAWYKENSGGRTHPVGGKKANLWGIHDMHGNVWEWCQDWYGDNPQGQVRDPVGPAYGVYRVYRGGSWNLDANYCRSANRHRIEPDSRTSRLGFRVVMPE